MRQWLLDIRENYELSRYDVAKKVGITTSYYRMIENNERTPSVNIAKQLGILLNFSWTLFFDD